MLKSTIVEIQLGGQPLTRQRNALKSTIVEIQLGGQPTTGKGKHAGIYNSRNSIRRLAVSDLLADIFIYNSRNSIRRLASNTINSSSVNLQQQKFNQAVSHYSTTSGKAHLQQQKFNQAVSHDNPDVHVYSSTIVEIQLGGQPRLVTERRRRYLQQQKFNQAVSLNKTICFGLIIYNSRNSIRRLASYPLIRDALIYNSRNSIRRLAGYGNGLTNISTIVEIQLGGQPAKLAKMYDLIYNSRNSIRRLAFDLPMNKLTSYLQQQKFNQAVSLIKDFGFRI